MNARQRAAQVAAQVQRERAQADAARATSGVVVFSLLRVHVKHGEVYSRKGFVRQLGPLSGACAGLMDLKPGSEAEYAVRAVIGVSTPRVGTIFVACSNGNRHETPLRMGTRAEMHKVDEEIARFNAMADAATGGTARDLQPTR